MKCFYNFFWDKRKSRKDEMLVEDGGTGKTVQQMSLEEFMEAAGAPSVSGVLQKGCAPHRW